MLVEPAESQTVKRQRLEDQVSRIREREAPESVKLNSTATKRGLDDEEIEEEAEIEEPLIDTPMPLAPPPPLRSEVLRQRKQKIARKLHRGEWSDNDD